MDRRGGELAVLHGGTVRSAPATQSPPAYTPGSEVRRSRIHRDAPVSRTARRRPSTGSATKLWPTAFSTMSAASTNVSPVSVSRPAASSVVRANSTPVDRAGSAPSSRDRRRPVADAHAVGLRPRLLLAGRGHLLGAAAIDDGDVLRAQPARLRGRVDRGVAAADHHDAAPDRHAILVGACRSSAMKSTASRTPASASPASAERLTPA